MTSCEMRGRWSEREADEHTLRFLAAERDFGAIVRDTEPESMRQNYHRVQFLRREFERRT